MLGYVSHWKLQWATVQLSQQHWTELQKRLQPIPSNRLQLWLIWSYQLCNNLRGEVKISVLCTSMNMIGCYQSAGGLMEKHQLRLKICNFRQCHGGSYKVRAHNQASATVVHHRVNNTNTSVIKKYNDDCTHNCTHMHHCKIPLIRWSDLSSSLCLF